MEVRLCDFGLAIENEVEGQNNICGNPNYIALELLNSTNSLKYSFEIDIWAFGIILYSLYYQKTPLEQETKEMTKLNIQNIIYSFPNEVAISKEAKDLISSILVREPKQRPKIEQIKSSPFFKNGEGIPKFLQTSTIIKPMTQLEEKKFVKNAIQNGECLDKEVNSPNKWTDFSTTEQNEYDSDYNSSSDDWPSKEEDIKSDEKTTKIY